MLEVENLSAGYGELRILFDINASLESGKITTIAGPNGSGKSTLLKAIFGLATIHSGRVLYRGRDITYLQPHVKTRMGIAYLPQVDNIFIDLTVEENLRMAGYILEEGEYIERRNLALEIFPDLKDRLKQNARTLSGGERQFLALATALIRRADLLMLDEPSAMLSPKFASTIFNKILELKEKFGLTILIVEQNIKKALEISDNAYVLINGRVVFQGTSKQLLEHEKFERFCIGAKVFD
ncbi:MAG: ABC transporter ATP-binding protein [Methanocellales archaeon]